MFGLPDITVVVVAGTFLFIVFLLLIWALMWKEVPV
jgi:hypothetical protein